MTETQQSKQVWNSLNASDRPKSYKVFDKKIPSHKSLTIPDQTMSMRTLVEKYVQGINLDAAKVGIFDEEDDGTQEGIDIRKLDLVDIQLLKQKNEEDITRLKNLKASAEEKLAFSKREQEIDAEIKRREALAKEEKGGKENGSQE